jgi:hypothetical protein
MLRTIQDTSRHGGEPSSGCPVPGRAASGQKALRVAQQFHECVSGVSVGALAYTFDEYGNPKQAAVVTTDNGSMFSA